MQIVPQIPLAGSVTTPADIADKIGAGRVALSVSEAFQERSPHFVPHDRGTRKLAENIAAAGDNTTAGLADRFARETLPPSEGGRKASNETGPSDTTRLNPDLSGISDDALIAETTKRLAAVASRVANLPQNTRCHIMLNACCSPSLRKPDSSGIVAYMGDNVEAGDVNDARSLHDFEVSCRDAWRKHIAYKSERAEFEAWKASRKQTDDGSPSMLPEAEQDAQSARTLAATLAKEGGAK